jgi:2',3'-cyclic-nucleotide 2'-phosphodiesterase (5'-nucleotidase family)
MKIKYQNKIYYQIIFLAASLLANSSIFCLTETLEVQILGTNDIHGAALERYRTTNKISHQIGGYKLLSGLINILRKQSPEGFLWLDAGD